MIPALADASPWIWAGLGIAELALPIFLGLLIGLLPSIRPFYEGDRTLWRRFWGTTVATLWITTAVVVLTMSQGGVVPPAVGVRVPDRTFLVWAASLVAGLSVGAIIAGARANGQGPTEQPALFLPYTRSERLLLVLVIAPSSAICEELLYRGYVLTFLQPVMGLWSANLVQSLLFGFHHGGIKQGTMALVARAALGFTLGLIVVRTGTLTAVIAAHFLLDAVLALRPSPSAAAQTV
jgi:CAAX protease family protein